MRNKLGRADLGVPGFEIRVQYLVVKPFNYMSSQLIPQIGCFKTIDLTSRRDHNTTLLEP